MISIQGLDMFMRKSYKGQISDLAQDFRNTLRTKGSRVLVHNETRAEAPVGWDTFYE